MAEFTPNYNLEKQQTNEFVNIEGINDNFDILDTEIKNASEKADQAFQQASDGKGKIKTAITGVDPEVVIPTNATFEQLADAISQIQTGVDTTDATALASQILAGMTAYVNEMKLTGTMTNRGAVSQSLPINGSYTIPAGYHNGSGVVTQSITTKSAATYTPGVSSQVIAAGQYLGGTQTILGDSDLLGSNIISDANIFGVQGTLAKQNTDGNGYNNMVAYSANAWASGGGRLHYPIKAGAYINNGSAVGYERNTPMGYIDDAEFISSNILNTVNIFGLQGGIPVYDPDYSDQRPAGSASAGAYSGDGANYAYMQISPNVYHRNVNYIRSYQPDLLAGNILSGKNIFGVAGSAITGKRWASGTVISSATTVQFEYADGSAYVNRTHVVVSGLTFKPTLIFLSKADGSTSSITVYDTISPVWYSPTFKVVQMATSSASNSVYNYKANTLGAYVNSTGFCAPIYHSSAPYNWIAVE